MSDILICKKNFIKLKDMIDHIIKSISYSAFWLITVFYFPVYVSFWALHKVARLLLAICYMGMLDFRTGKDILVNLFNWHAGAFGDGKL